MITDLSVKIKSCNWNGMIISVSMAINFDLIKPDAFVIWWNREQKSKVNIVELRVIYNYSRMGGPSWLASRETFHFHQRKEVILVFIQELLIWQLSIHFCFLAGFTAKCQFLERLQTKYCNYLFENWIWEKHIERRITKLSCNSP